MPTAAMSFIISLALLLPAAADTFLVTTLADAGPGSLRQAIMDANDSTADDTIQISVQGSIVLLTELEALLGNIVINGPGAKLLTISPDPDSAFQGPIFNVDSAAVISIDGVSLKKCRNGAITNNGTLTLDRCVLSGNENLQNGGAILNLGNLVVRRSTLSENVAKGAPGPNTGPAQGGAIFSLGFGHLSVVNSTISGNRVVGADGVTGEFLTRKFSGEADQADSDMYYGLVDPVDAQHPKGRRGTLGEWWETNGFNPADGSASDEAKAAYLNNGDLGFGRDMHMLQRNNDVAAYVSNYTLNLDRSSPDQNPLSADAALAKDPARAIATVCMEYSPIENQTQAGPIVKFFVYEGTGPNAIRVGYADLDGNGKKYTPQLCMVCHGGTQIPQGHGWTLGQVLGMKSYFREFDLASFKFPRPGTRVDDPRRSIPDVPPNAPIDEEAAFKRLNEKVLATNPSAAIRELIEGWYAPNFTASTQNTAFVPPGWNTQAQLYRDIVGTSCRTCHVAQEGIYDFSTYDKFAEFYGSIRGEVLGNSTKVMPHAKVAFGNFWRAGRQNTLANFTGPGWPQIGTGAITGSPAGPARGGAIFSQGFVTEPFFNIVFSTIALNTAASGVGTINGTAGGGGIVSANSSSVLGNTLIANNFIRDLPAFGSQDISGSVTSTGYNLIGNTSGATIAFPPQLSDLLNIADPEIAPLVRQWFRPTPTHALLYDSPAIDQGSAATDPVSGLPIATDQRGVRRPADEPSIPNAVDGNGSDIGAYERGNGWFGNIATRAPVFTGSNVMIAGFILQGEYTKRVYIRAAGPSLANFGIPGVLADPVLELHGPGATITNDNWRDTQEAEIIATGIPPTNDLESAIVATLAPGAYTAIVQGVNSGTGVGIVEVYDLSAIDGSLLANISTRAFVGTGDNVMIGGIIVLGQDELPVIVRAIGPSLPVPGALGDPTLELRDGNAALIAFNDNWRSDQEEDIIASTIPPTNDLESTIVQILAPGLYTAIVRGVNNTTGVALVEAYGVN
ncbi:MAG TPA: choice-of-anchor Q domain-containing protein [Chthoniobacterales bacterium]|nr:choice-of-anchor Q domain-containing protein [Chthoniobacterales bacterium]